MRIVIAFKGIMNVTICETEYFVCAYKYDL